MEHLTLERNSHYLILESLTAGTNVKDIAFSTIITRNKYVSLTEMLIFTQCCEWHSDIKWHVHFNSWQFTDVLSVSITCSQNETSVST